MKSNQHKKNRISLDKLKNEGRLKGSGPDIAEVWGAHRKKQNSKSTPSKLQEKLSKGLKSIKFRTAKVQKSLKKGVKSKNINVVQKATNIVKKQSRKKMYSMGFAAALVIGLLMMSISNGTKDGTTDTLGAQEEKQSTANESQQSENQDNQISQEQLPFTPLLPSGVEQSSIKSVTRKSPSGSVIYSLQHYDDGNEIQVTEQEMPENFIGKEAAEIEKMAKDLQAVSVIQIDDNKIYHGLSEKTNVQTLITSKNGLLIFIRSNQKQTDDYWMSYYLSLK